MESLTCGDGHASGHRRRLRRNCTLEHAWIRARRCGAKRATASWTSNSAGSIHEATRSSRSPRYLSMTAEWSPVERCTDCAGRPEPSQRSRSSYTGSATPISPKRRLLLRRYGHCSPRWRAGSWWCTSRGSNARFSGGRWRVTAYDFTSPFSIPANSDSYWRLSEMRRERRARSTNWR